MKFGHDWACGVQVVLQLAVEAVLVDVNQWVCGDIDSLFSITTFFACTTLWHSWSRATCISGLFIVCDGAICPLLHRLDQLSITEHLIAGTHFSQLYGEPPLNSPEGVERIQQLRLLIPGIEALQQIVCKQQVLWYLVH